MATPNRRAEDNTLTDIKVSIGKIETHMERSVPALEQVWKNEKAILKIGTKQNVIVTIGGMVGLATITMVIRTISTYFSKNPPPPHLPH